MNKENIEAKVVSLTRKIHPQDLGEETSKLENILRQALEEAVAEKRIESGSSILSKTTFGSSSPNQFKKYLEEILNSSPFTENREYSNYLLAAKDREVEEAGQVAIKRYQELIQEELEQELTKAKIEAIAEERKRVVGEIKSRMPSHDAVMEYLGTLDKPLTDNE